MSLKYEPQHEQTYLPACAPIQGLAHWIPHKKPQGFFRQTAKTE